METSLKNDVITIRNKMETVTELIKFYKNWPSCLKHLLLNKYPFIIIPRNSNPVKVNTRNEMSMLTNKLYFNPLYTDKKIIKYGGISQVCVSGNKLYKQFKYNNEYKKELKNTIIASKLIKNVNIPEIISYDNNKKIIVYEYINGKSFDFALGNNKNIMPFDEYKKSIEIISLIHNTKYGNYIKTHDMYLDKKFGAVYKFDYKNICSDYKDKLKFIHNFIVKNNKMGKVLSHGDFKPDNIIIDNNKDIFVTDWEFFCIRYPMYDFGSIVYGLDYNKIIELADLYLKYRNIKYDNINNFIKESIAYACITHINGALRDNKINKVTGFIDYAYNVCLHN